MSYLAKANSVEIDKNTDKDYTDILYVSANGSGTNGLSWTTAYTTLGAAITAASANANRFTLIHLAPGTYDINTAGTLTISKNIELRGVSQRNTVIITNTNVGATGVLTITGKFVLRNCMIDMKTAINGIHLQASGVIIDNVYFEGDALASGKSALICGDGGAVIEYVFVNNCRFEGEVTAANLTAIVLTKCAYSRFMNITIDDALLGLSIASDATTKKNIFAYVYLRSCATGINIGANAAYNTFRDISLSNNTTNVVDASATSLPEWQSIHTRRFYPKAYPDSTTGVTINGHANANTYNAWTQLVPVSTITSPFRILGLVMVAPTNVGVFQIEIGIGAAPSVALAALIMEVVSTSGSRIGGTSEMPGEIIPANSAIYLRHRCSVGGRHATFFLKYITYA